jgi:hypothetical protein
MTGHSNRDALCVIGRLRREASTLVRAWYLTEGDQAFGGETVVVLHRDALRRTIIVSWDDGRRANLDGEGWVALARRAPACADRSAGGERPARGEHRAR